MWLLTNETINQLKNYCVFLFNSDQQDPDAFVLKYPCDSLRIIIIDNVCIVLFPGVHKLTALYNILQHFLSEKIILKIQHTPPLHPLLCTHSVSHGSPVHHTHFQAVLS